MKFFAIMQDIVYQSNLPPAQEIIDITCNSKKARENMIFACLKGEKFDGHTFAADAAENGAFILCDHSMGIKNEIIVQDTREAYAKICANFYGNPSKRLKFIGITGTNGKTTITNIIRQILNMHGYKVGLIGTIHNKIGDQIIKTDKTTPDPKTFQQLIFQMAEANCDYVVMEVSSHALAQHRLADTQFCVGAFTNLTQDHLDYHKSMEEYYQAKKRLFAMSKKAVVCVDDAYGQRLAKEIPCTTFSIRDKNADAVAENIKMDVHSVAFAFMYDGKSYPLHFQTPGLFSVQNAMTAVLVCLAIGFTPAQMVTDLQKCVPIKGRSERIPTGRDFSVICDYAHSPDGLKNILESVQAYKQGRLVVLFGCGGDRDKEKRPLMGEIAARYSDFMIITSDNPRTESPDAIIDDIVVGIKDSHTPYVRITNRREAISYALMHAQSKDIIVLAGKGHEDYQVLGTQKIHFDEREIVAELLEKIKN